MTKCPRSLASKPPDSRPTQEERRNDIFSFQRSLECESAPKWDPFSSSGKHLISARKFVRGRVPVGADRDPCWWRAFSVRSATYAEIRRGFHFGADSQPLGRSAGPASCCSKASVRVR